MRKKKIINPLCLIAAELIFVMLIPAFSSCGKEKNCTGQAMTGETGGYTVAETENDTENMSDSENGSLSELLRSDTVFGSVCTKVLNIPVLSSVFSTIQGGWIDNEGKYIYQTFMKKDTMNNEEDNEVRIVKYDLGTGKKVSVSKRLPLNHANDITWCPDKNCLAVVNGKPHRKIVSLIDPDSLELKKTVELPLSIYCLDYSKTYEKYVVGISGGQDFRFLNREFQYADEDKVFGSTDITVGYTTQGCSTDDDFIYFVLYKENAITVYDWDGNFVCVIRLDIYGIEPENISVRNGEIYIVCAESGATVYKVTPVPLDSTVRRIEEGGIKYAEENKKSLREIIPASDSHNAVCLKVMNIPAVSDTVKTPQGGWIDKDGKYIYQAFIKKEPADQTKNIVRIVKYDLSTGEKLAESEDMSLEHANDITWCPTENCIIVANCTDPLLSLIDPDTLEFKRNIELPLSIYSIDYSESRGKYVVGLSGGQDFNFLNTDFEISGSKKKYRATNLTKGYTTQGCAADDDFIYFVLYKKNVITVYDWDGNFVSLIKLDLNSIEPENISIVDDSIYISCYLNGTTVYKVVLTDMFDK